MEFVMMQYSLTVTIFTGQEQLIKTRGDKIWEEITDASRERIFTISDLVDQVPCLKAYSPITQRQYLRVVLLNVYAGQDKDEPVLERLSTIFWRWV